MAYYLTTHYEPSASEDVIHSRWRVLARERRAVWLKTWFNLRLGKRFCWWDAPNKEVLEAVFRDHGVPWHEIDQVRLTTPSEWRWRED